MTNKIGASWVYAANQELKRWKFKAALGVGVAGLSKLSVTGEERWLPIAKEVKFLEAAADLPGVDCLGRHLAS